MRASTNIALKQRSTLTLEDFKGVDFTASPYRLSPNRAADAANLIYENGANRKRRGWRQRLSSDCMQDNGVFAEPTAIDGIFQYRYGDKNAVLIVAGGILYEYDPHTLVCNKAHDTVDYEDTPPTGRCQFFMNKGKCYIVSEGGDVWVYGTDSENEWMGHILRPLSKLYYIPTTTISIDRSNLEDTGRGALEYPNILTPWRKNGLRMSENEGDTKYYTYELDSPIDPDKGINVKIFYKMEDTGDGWFTNEINLSDAHSFEVENDIHDSFISVKKYLVDRYFKAYGAVLEWGGYDGTTRKNGKIALKNFTPPDESDNVTVTFAAAPSVWDYDSDLINHCRFGALFGTNGNTDRLFLSGNPDYPNEVYFSGFDELTYFPDSGGLVVGGDHAPITGLARVSDRSLAVFKEAREGESTVFYITGEQKPIYDASGNMIGGDAVFTVAGGGEGEGCISPYATANLAGEAIFLSEESIYAVSPSENATTGVRNVRERGQPISRPLRGIAASNPSVCATVFDGRYYLSDGASCFVADSRHKYYPAEGSVDGAYQYEWWYWENVPARVWGTVDGVLWFGTEDGRVCSFDPDDTDRYADESFLWLQAGELAVNDGYIVYPDSLVGQIREGDLLETPDGRLRVTELHEFLTESGVSCHAFRLREYADDEKPLTGLCERLPSLGSQPTRLWHRETVAARWISPYLNLGSDLHEKTLLALTVTAGEDSGRFRFGYETKRAERREAMRGIDAMSFEDLSFERFSFENAFASSYTVRMRERDINYIRFCFFSDTPEELTVERLTALYKINRMNGGVR